MQGHLWEAVLAVDSGQWDQMLHSGQECCGSVYLDYSLSSMAEIPVDSVSWVQKVISLDLHGHVVQHLTGFAHREWCAL